MKLSEIKTEGNLKVLLIGEPGVGKTIFAAGFPYPMLYLDFDNKVDSAALFYKNDKARLDGIDVRVLKPSLELSPIDQFEQIIVKELIPAQSKGEMPWKTIVIDSITTFSSATLNHIVKTNPGIKRNVSKQGQQPGLQDYGILKREFQKLISGILALPCNVVMLAHIAVDKDENTGEILRHASMDGSFARELPIYFKEVWRAYAEKDKRLAQTQSDGRYNCRSQIPGLPNPLPLSYSEIEKYIK